MSARILLQRYLNGDFDININELSTEDRVKYVQTTNLIAELVRAADNLVEISKISQQSKERRESDEKE